MNKDRIIELAREAELVRQLALEVPFVVDRLEHFVVLIEAEVRGGMSRDNVFELMLAAGCSKYCDPKHPELEGFIVNDSVLDRIVALIEREVRGDAEPVARLRFYKGEVVVTKDYETVERNGEFDVYTHPAPAASAESVASVHIKDGCLIGSQRKSGVDIPDGQYALYPIGTSPAPAVVAQLVDGLAGLIDFIEIDNLRIDQDAFRIAKAALATAKANGL